MLGFLLNELLSSSNGVGLLMCYKARYAPRLSLWTDRQRSASSSCLQVKWTARRWKLPRLLRPTAPQPLGWQCPGMNRPGGRQRKESPPPPNKLIVVKGGGWR